MIIFTGVLALLLALAHVAAAQLPGLDARHRRVWLSAAAGVAVAYVFIHLLPALVEFAPAVDGSLWPTADEHRGRFIYIVALLGLAAYYGIERLAVWFKDSPDSRQQDQAADTRIFWIHIAAFALYNMLAGYLLVHQFTQTLSTLLFALALGVHFLVNDYAMEQHHLRDYRNKGRWVLAAGVLAGWALAIVWPLTEAAVAMLFAFFAGGVIVNVLKEELPGERQGRFIPFFIAAACFGALLLAVD